MEHRRRELRLEIEQVGQTLRGRLRDERDASLPFASGRLPPALDAMRDNQPEGADVSAGHDDPELSWDCRRGGGREEFQAARARFLATLAGQSALVCLERAWSLPAHDPQAAAGGPDQAPAPQRLGDVHSCTQDHSKLLAILGSEGSSTAPADLSAFSACATTARAARR